MEESELTRETVKKDKRLCSSHASTVQRVRRSASRVSDSEGEGSFSSESLPKQTKLDPIIQSEMITAMLKMERLSPKKQKEVVEKLKKSLDEADEKKDE